MSKNVQPLILFRFALKKASGVHAKANEKHEFLLCSPKMEFSFFLQTARGSVNFDRVPSKTKPLWGPDAVYRSEPVSSVAYEALAQEFESSKKPITGKATFQVKYKAFFLEALRRFTLQTGTENLARPGAGKARVLESFKWAKTAQRATITHIDATVELKNVDIEATFSKVDRNGAAAPTGSLSIKLDLDKLGKRAEEAVMVLMAQEWTSLYSLKKEVVKKGKTDYDFSVPALNMTNYIALRASIARGEKIFDEIVAEAKKGTTPLDAAKRLRDALDERMITSNHWGDSREDWVTEEYQRILSDLFGAIDQNNGQARPVNYLRALHTRRFLDLDKLPKVEVSEVFLILQLGVGHCSEHAKVAFAAVRKILGEGDGPGFKNAILCGNANIDHDFVVGGVRVKTTWQVERTKKARGEDVGKIFRAFNIGDTLAESENAGRDGWVIDAYLANPAKTVKDLYAALSSPKRGPTATEYAFYYQQMKAGTPPQRDVPAEDEASTTVKGV